MMATISGVTTAVWIASYKVARTECSIKAVISGSLLVSLIGLSLGFLVTGPSHSYSEWTVLWGLAIGAALILGLQLSRGDLFAQLAILAVLFLVYVFPRLFSYLFTPNLVELQFGQGFSSDDTNRGLSYLFLGTVFLIAGYLAAELATRRLLPPAKVQGDEQGRFPILVAVLFLCCAGLVEYGVSEWLEVTAYGKLRAETGNVFVQIVKGFFGLDAAFFVLLAVFVLNGKQASYRKQILVLAVIGYAGFITFGGSRIAGLRILLMTLAILLCVRSNFRAKVSQYVVGILCLGALSVVLYPVGTQMRIKKSVEFNQTFERLEEFSQEGVGLYSSLSKLWASVANRLGAGLVDSEIAILSKKEDPVAKNKYLNFEYAVKSVINYCLPGVPFPEAKLSTSRVIPIIYKGLSEEDVKSHGYFSEVWTAWGLAYAWFGKWGGLVALCIAGMIAHAGYRLVPLVSGNSVPFVQSFYLFLVPQLTYLTSGLDHSITTALVSFLQVAIALGVISLIGKLFRCSRA